MLRNHIQTVSWTFEKILLVLGQSGITLDRLIVQHVHLEFPNQRFRQKVTLAELF